MAVPGVRGGEPGRQDLLDVRRHGASWRGDPSRGPDPAPGQRASRTPARTTDPESPRTPKIALSRGDGGRKLRALRWSGGLRHPAHAGRLPGFGRPSATAALTRRSCADLASSAEQRTTAPITSYSRLNADAAVRSVRRGTPRRTHRQRRRWRRETAATRRRRRPAWPPPRRIGQRSGRHRDRRFLPAGLCGRPGSIPTLSLAPQPVPRSRSVLPRAEASRCRPSRRGPCRHHAARSRPRPLRLAVAAGTSAPGRALRSTRPAREADHH